MTGIVVVGISDVVTKHSERSRISGGKLIAPGR